MSDKIKVSVTDVYSSRVDDRLRSQDALSRTQQHWQSQVSASDQVAALKGMVPGAATGGAKGFWYNTIVYTAVFGLLGGLLAWGLGEGASTVCMTRAERIRQLTLDRFGPDIFDMMVRASNGDPVAEARILTVASEWDGFVASVREDPELAEFMDAGPEEKARISDVEIIWTMAAWFAVIGMGISIAIGIADPLVSGRWQAACLSAALGAVVGLVGGALAGALAQPVYQWLLGDAEGGVKAVLARTLAWGLAGLFVAIAPGLILRNWKRLAIGIVGGGIGGLLGGLLFNQLGEWTGGAGLSRFVGIVSIGVFAAVGTSLIEAAVKTGWLRVVAGLIAGKQFILYRNPTTIGSSPQCEIYLFKDTAVAPRHAAIHVGRAGCELESLHPGMPAFVNGQAVSRRQLRRGDQIQVGGTVFEFGERVRR